MQVCTCGGACPQNAAGERWPAGGLVAPSPGRNKVCLACAFWGRGKASLVVHASCGQTSDDRGTINFRYMGRQGGPNPFTNQRAVKLVLPFPPIPFPSFFLFFYQTLLTTTRAIHCCLAKLTCLAQKEEQIAFSAVCMDLGLMTKVSGGGWRGIGFEVRLYQGQLHTFCHRSLLILSSPVPAPVV